MIEVFSPIQRVNLPEIDNLGIGLYIKRDDLIHPFVSGNKWRKLKYHLEDARQQGKNTIVTFGGAFSNHLLATAAMGAIAGLKTIGVVRGEEVKNSTLFLCKLHGMKLVFVDRERYRNKEKLYQELFADNQDAYFVDEGGRGILGAKGCAEIVEELDTAFDHIVCAAGTGCTVAGILQGLNNIKSQTKVHVVPVLKGADFLQKDIMSYPDISPHFDLWIDYHFGGYAKANSILLDFVLAFTSGTGIMLDPVYTGKAMFGLLDKIKQGIFAPQQKILFVHTGGLIGALGMQDNFFG